MLPAALGHSRLYVPMSNPPIAAWGPVNVAASARRLITPARREKLERQTFKAALADQRGKAPCRTHEMALMPLRSLAFSLRYHPLAFGRPATPTMKLGLERCSHGKRTA